MAGTNKYAPHPRATMTGYTPASPYMSGLNAFYNLQNRATSAFPNDRSGRPSAAELAAQEDKLGVQTNRNGHLEPFGAQFLPKQFGRGAAPNAPKLPPALDPNNNPLSNPKDVIQNQQTPVANAVTPSIGTIGNIGMGSGSSVLSPIGGGLTRGFGAPTSPGTINNAPPQYPNSIAAIKDDAVGGTPSAASAFGGMGTEIGGFGPNFAKPLPFSPGSFGNLNTPTIPTSATPANPAASAASAAAPASPWQGSANEIAATRQMNNPVQWNGSPSTIGSNATLRSQFGTGSSTIVPSGGPSRMMVNTGPGVAPITGQQFFQDEANKPFKQGIDAPGGFVQTGPDQRFPNAFATPQGDDLDKWRKAFSQVKKPDNEDI